ncbi:MAG: hypothetical protein AAF368_16510, partial [Planctomycetota bacterium]
MLEEATRAAKQAERARADANQAKVDHEAAVTAHKENEVLLQKANAAAVEVAPLREKVARLNRILGRLPERDRLTKAIEQQRTDVATTKEKVDGLRTALAESSERQVEQSGAVDNARAALEGISYDTDLDAALEKVRDLAAKLSVSREALKTVADETARRQKAFADLTGRIELLEREAKGASQVEAEAQKVVDAADEAVHAAHRLNAANHLRESLTTGDACPVCEQVVNDPPPADLHPDVEKAKSEREQAALKLKDVRKKAREKHKVLTREQANAETAKLAKEEAEDDNTKAKDSVSQQEDAIRALLDGRRPNDEQLI